MKCSRWRAVGRLIASSSSGDLSKWVRKTRFCPFSRWKELNTEGEQTENYGYPWVVLPHLTGFFSLKSEHRQSTCLFETPHESLRALVFPKVSAQSLWMKRKECWGCGYQAKEQKTFTHINDYMNSPKPTRESWWWLGRLEMEGRQGGLSLKSKQITFMGFVQAHAEFFIQASFFHPPITPDRLRHTQELAWRWPRRVVGLRKS